MPVFAWIYAPLNSYDFKGCIWRQVAVSFLISTLFCLSFLFSLSVYLWWSHVTIGLLPLNHVLSVGQVSLALRKVLLLFLKLTDCVHVHFDLCVIMSFRSKITFRKKNKGRRVRTDCTRVSCVCISSFLKLYFNDCVVFSHLFTCILISVYL